MIKWYLFYFMLTFYTIDIFIVPKRPPRTDIGSFEYFISLSDKSKRDIVIYWQTIEDNEKCGESFEYIAYYIYTTEDNQIS